MGTQVDEESERKTRDDDFVTNVPRRRKIQSPKAGPRKKSKAKFGPRQSFQDGNRSGYNMGNQQADTSADSAFSSIVSESSKSCIPTRSGQASFYNTRHNTTDQRTESPEFNSWIRNEETENGEDDDEKNYQERSRSPSLVSLPSEEECFDVFDAFNGERLFYLYHVSIHLTASFCYVHCIV